MSTDSNDNLASPVDLRYRKIVIAISICALVIWVLMFSAGLIIDTTALRLRIQKDIDTHHESSSYWADYWQVMIAYTPANVAILSIMAGLLGGCASNLAWMTDQKDLKNSVADLMKQPEIDLQGHTLIRRASYMKENPVVAMIRGFVVYLAILAGILMTVENPFPSQSPSKPSQTEQKKDESPAAAAIPPGKDPKDPRDARDVEIEIAQRKEQALREGFYLRYAGFVSLLAFVMGFDPTRFEQLLRGIPVSPSPAKSQGTASTVPSVPKHAAVKATEDFYAALQAEKWDEAEKLTVPNSFATEALRKMKDLQRLEQMQVQEASIGQEQSVIVTNEIAPRVEGKGEKGRWGVTLQLINDTWLIRDIVLLENDEAVKRFLEQFQKREPTAKKAPLGA